MLALYIIGGLFLFLLILTLIPVRVEAAFQEELELVVKYLFLRFPLQPGEEAPEKAEEPAPPEKGPPAGPSMADRIKAAMKQRGLWGFLQVLAEFVGVAAKASLKLLSHLHLKKFDLYLCLDGGGDAALAAVRYGQVSAGVYGACGLLFTKMPCRKKGVTVDMDYSLAEGRVAFSAELSLRPLFVLAAGLKIIKGALPVLKMLRAPVKNRPHKRLRTKEAAS